MNAQTEMTDEEIDTLWENCSDPCQPEISIHFFARSLIAHLTKPDAGGGDHVRDATKLIVEPFGYFRCTLDGWLDCAENDEGARPLYEASQLDARVPEATRELVDGLRGLESRYIGLFDVYARKTYARGISADRDLELELTDARALIAKYTQTQKESK